MIDSIIFDLDGTLWDSTEIVANAWNRIIQSETGFPADITGSRLKQLFGKLLSDIAAEIFPTLSKEEQIRLIDRCCEAEHQALRETPAPLYPDLEKVLNELSKKYPLFIVSNCQAGYIELFLEVTGLSGLFTGHLCPGDTGKEKAENIRLVIERYQLQSPVYVGDTEGDQSAAKAANVPFIWASYGFRTVQNPDYRINALSDLESLL